MVTSNSVGPSSAFRSLPAITRTLMRIHLLARTNYTMAAPPIVDYAHDKFETGGHDVPLCAAPNGRAKVDPVG
jgi:hypothetical protein